MTIKAKTPFVNFANAELKARIPSIQSAVTKTLNVGCGKSNAYEIAAACAGYKDYNTAKAVMSGDFYQVAINMATSYAPQWFFSDIGMIDCYDEAREAFEVAIRDLKIVTECELYKNGTRTGYCLKSATNNDVPEYVAYISSHSDSVVINEVEIDDDVFEGMVDWRLLDKSEKIDDLYRDISEADGGWKEVMKQDLQTLQSLSDEYIFSSTESNEFISSSDDREQFNEICKEILAANAKVLAEKAEDEEHEQLCLRCSCTLESEEDKQTGICADCWTPEDEEN